MNTETEARYAGACSALISNLVRLDCKPRLPWLQGLAAFILALTALKTTPLPQKPTPLPSGAWQRQGLLRTDRLLDSILSGRGKPVGSPTAFNYFSSCGKVSVG